MTRHPFDSGELGRSDPEMDRVGQQLERYSAGLADEPPVDLAARIQASLDEEPTPATGWWASLLGALATWRGPARMALAAAVVVAAVVAALTLGDLADRARNNTGATPSPSVTITPTPTASPTASPTPPPSASPTASPSLSPTQTPTPLPTESDHDDDELETPEPSESDDDNSGPGGGGGGNSGPGGGG
ncbi:MAG TPA: hypothetical protein VF364_09625 [Candidatus Limnocylindria bacterium]